MNIPISKNCKEFILIHSELKHLSNCRNRNQTRFR